MKMRWLLAALALSLLLALGAAADIYRWTDAKGILHFTNEPPPPGGVLVERIEEVPHDAEADRRRREEERRVLIERQKTEIEERKAGLELREREAARKLEEAQRTLKQAEQQAEQAEQAERSRREDCSDEYFSRFGSCEGYPVIIHHHKRPAAQKDLYRNYTRKDGSLYYEERPKPPVPKPPVPPKEGRESGKPPKAAPKADTQTGKAAPDKPKAVPPPAE